jgi:hypothetical protein
VRERQIYVSALMVGVFVFCATLTVFDDYHWRVGLVLTGLAGLIALWMHTNWEPRP